MSYSTLYVCIFISQLSYIVINVTFTVAGVTAANGVASVFHRREGGLSIGRAIDAHVTSGSVRPRSLEGLSSGALISAYHAEHFVS